MRKVSLLATMVLFALASLIHADATVALVVGKVFVKTGNSQKWTTVKLNQKLGQKEMVQVGPQSRLVLKFSDGSTFLLNTPRTMTMESIMAQKKADDGKKISVKEKTSKIRSKERPAGSATAVAGVRGADADKQGDEVKAKDVKWK